MSPRACRTCKIITEENICPICRSSDLSDDFSGLAIILDPEGSDISRAMGVKNKGRYALRVR